MRPRRLEVEAMGPFGSLVEIDFDELAVEGLFLIHGPTGAGKTSLFDAVSFALYGKVPGARGSARSDRSHFAARGVEPRAALEFDAQGGRYRVERTAAWEAPKVRGSGTTPRPTTASLRRIDPGNETLLASKTSEVDREIERLVGLTATQFQQVILLPQGKFERLLQANSREREELFETLFDTLDFRVASEWLDEQARRRRNRVAALRQQLGVIGDEALRRSDDILRTAGGAGMESPLGASAGSNPGSVAVLAWSTAVLDGDPHDPGVVDSLVLALADALDRLVTEADVAAESERVARLDLETAKSVRERVLRRTSLRTEFDKLTAASADVDATRLLHARSLEAESLRATLDDVLHRTNVVRRNEQAVSADLAAARQAVEDLVVTVDPLSDLDLSSLPATRALADVLGAVTTRSELLARLRATAQRADEAEAERESVTRELRRQLAAGDAAGVRLGRCRGQLPELRTAVEASRAAGHRLADLEAVATEAATRARAGTELADLRPLVAKADQDVIDAQRAANSARADHLAAMQRYLDGIAAHLAGRLELDAACSVCGSHDHPHPAQPAADAVSEDDVARLDGAAFEAEQRRDVLVEAHHRLANDAASLKAVAGPAALDLDAARQLAERTRSALREAKELAAALESRTALLTEVEQAVASDTELVAAAESAAAAAREQLAVLDERMNEAKAALAEQLPEGVTLEAALSSLSSATTALTRVADHAAGGQEAEIKLTAARERAASDVESSPFDSASDARRAMLDPADRAALLAKIERHDRRHGELAALLADPSLTDAPDTAPDVEKHEREAADAERVHRAVRESLTLAVSARDAVAKLATEHRMVAEDLAQAESEAALFTAVADRCVGRTAPKVPLQRWVLGTYLEEVCEHANRRLATMTSGRYRLRVTRAGARANSPAGLDLRVHDANTNQEREVSTLSGGETFQASLALALGVADSVEAHTGGVRLDALFIDEGFGTLDADSLELAMDELDTLREGGRMIGVISHVAGLKERINVGVEVTKTDQGSRVEIGTV